MKKKEISDVFYLIQVVLLICLLMFFVLSRFIVEFELVYQMILVCILLVIAYNNRDRNSKLITYLYYFSAFCVFISIIIGVLNGQ